MDRNSEPRIDGRGPRAFTLVEMLVVLAIVVAVLALVIPGLSVWEGHKVATALNQCSGLLKSAQTQALNQRRVVGLLFFIDPASGAQNILPIEPALHPAWPERTAERFRVANATAFALPKPMRVVPLAVLDPQAWSVEQLADNDLQATAGLGAPDPPYDGTAATGAQFQRNFFVVLFDPTGEARPGKRVFIWDPDPPDRLDPMPHPGLRTGLTVSGTEHEWAPGAVIADGPAGQEPPLLFESATGLLLYDDESFQELPAGRREFLRDNSEPLYFHPRTGRILHGDRPPVQPQT